MEPVRRAVCGLPALQLEGAGAGSFPCSLGVEDPAPGIPARRAHRWSHPPLVEQPTMTSPVGAEVRDSFSQPAPPPAP